MSWARLDDQIAFHWKTVQAGNDAFGAWVRMLAYACAHRTNGAVTEAVAFTITNKKQLDRLVGCRLLERTKGAYQIHDFLMWNPKAEEVEQRRSKKQASARLGGLRSAEGRRTKKEASGQANGQALCLEVASPSVQKIEASSCPVASSSVQPNLNQTSTPSPSPSPSPSPISSPNGELFPPDVPPGVAKAGAKRLRHKTPNPSEHRAVVAAYAEAYTQATGKAPVIGAKEGRAAQTLLRTMSEEQACETIRAAFGNDWFCKTGLELTLIAGSPNRWRAGQAAIAPNGKGGFVQPRAEATAPWRQSDEVEEFARGVGEECAS